LLRKGDEEMNSMILYCSITGGTEKVAKSIAQELNGTLVNLKKASISTIHFNDIDFLFLGSGVYGGKLHSNIMKLTKNNDFLKAVTENIQILGLFSTYATSSESSKKAIADFKQALPSQTRCNLEEFYCQGNLFKIFGLGRPIAKDVEKAISWAKQITSQ